MKRFLLAIVLVTALGFVVKAAPAVLAPSLNDVRREYAAYNLDEASSLLDKYVARRSRQRAAADVDSIDAWGNRIDVVEDMRARILLARNMLDRVEKVEVIDSINVPREEFFSMMRLDPSAGCLLDESAVSTALSDGDVRRAVEPVYSSESGDMLLWVGYDDSDAAESDEFTLYESNRLADGKFADARKLFTRRSLFPDGLKGEIFTPFLMPDGLTLYFAADGPQSLGGLDIFIARRDGEGGFLQPSNLGMPFNSPANDYMMAIDEVTGLGWWVTDRNAPEGMVTIYLYIPSELRVNFPVDTENLADYALLTKTYRSERPESDVRARIESLKRGCRPSEAKSRVEIEFALPDGRVITSPSQLRDRTARELMESYMADREALQNLETELQKLRESYASGDRSVSETILDDEKKLESARRALAELANDIVRAEQ